MSHSSPKPISNTAPPPEPPRSKQPLGRIIAVGSIGVAAVAILIFAVMVLSQATRRDMPEDYTLLARMLFEPITLNGETAVKLSEAEQELKAEELRVEIQRIARRDRKLSSVASEMEKIFQGAEEIAKNAPQGSKIILGLAEALLGGYTGQRELVGSGGQKALQETERGWGAIQGVMALFDRKHVSAIKLAGLAPQFSGPLTNAPMISCAFAEHQPGFLEASVVQSLAIKNLSSNDVADCTIAVRLSNADGKSHVNVHYASQWPAGGVLTARYSDTDFPDNTIDGVVRVDVSVWTDKWSVDSCVLKKPADGWTAF